MTSSTPAIFIDRDGTLNDDKGYVHRTQDLVLRPGVREGIGILGRLGVPLVVVTNQGGIGRGLFSVADMHAFNQALARQLQAAGGAIRRFYWCPHHPQGVDAAARVDCACRKPKPGLLHQAARDLGIDLARSVILGDHERDVLAGRAAGCATIYIRYGNTNPPPPSDHTAEDFLDAARVAQRLIPARLRPQPGEP